MGGGGGVGWCVCVSVGRGGGDALCETALHKSVTDSMRSHSSGQTLQQIVSVSLSVPHQLHIQSQS